MKVVARMLRILLRRPTEARVQRAADRESERDRVSKELAQRQHAVARRVHVLEWQTGIHPTEGRTRETPRS